MNVANRLPEGDAHSQPRQAAQTGALALVDEFLQLKQELPFQTAGSAKAQKKRSREEFESDVDYAWHQVDSLNKRSATSKFPYFLFFSSL